MKAGLIVNPAAARGSGKGLALAHKLAGSRHVEVRVLDAFGGLASILEDLARKDVSVLFISSGDGTVQAIQTVLGEASPFSKQPMLALLPHGTTNMNAADVGFRARSLDDVADLMSAPDRLVRATAVKQRYCFRVVNPAKAGPQHGMFFGAGALAHAALQTQSQLNVRGIGGQMAPAVTLVRSLGKVLFTAPNPDDRNRIDRPYPMDVFCEGELKASGDQLLLLVTTLSKLVLGTRPFWGGATQPLRATTIAYPPPNLLRHALPLMYGAEDMRPPSGCASFSGRVIEADFEGPFLIDGQFFQSPSDEPLRIETGIKLDYLCG